MFGCFYSNITSCTIGNTVTADSVTASTTISTAVRTNARTPMMMMMMMIIIIIITISKHSIDSLQKTAILGTSHIIWKVLQCEA